MAATLLEAVLTGQASVNLLADVHHCDGVAILRRTSPKSFTMAAVVPWGRGLPFSTRICIVQPPKKKVTDMSPPPKASVQPVRSSILPSLV